MISEELKENSLSSNSIISQKKNSESRQRALNQQMCLQPLQMPKQDSQLVLQQTFNGNESPWQQSRKSGYSKLDSSKSMDKQEMMNKYHEQWRVIDAGQKNLKFLEAQLQRSKLFLNMVVHDMRNPTKSIKMGLSTSISKLRSLLKIKQDYDDFEQSCSVLQNHITMRGKNHQMTDGVPDMTVRIQVLNDQVEQTFKNLHSEHLQFELMTDGVSDSIKVILDEISKEYSEPEILDESFEDFDLDQLDEHGQEPMEDDDQIVQNNIEGSFKQNINKLSEFNDSNSKNQSQLLQDKQTKLQKALQTMLDKFPSTNSSKTKLIQDFVSQYYLEEGNSLNRTNQITAFKPEMNDFSQQIDFDFETRYKAAKIDQIKDKISDMQLSQQKIQEHLSAQKDQICVQQSTIRNQLQHLAFQNDEHFKLERIMKKQITIQSKFYAQSFQTVYEKTKETENTLQQQMFSQQMMENLINDLLDLAKMQNNTFQFNNAYFSLTNVIYEAFQMLISSANENGIELRSEIDFKANLQLIEAVDGDENRILQILLNFLSNSLKFTDPGGTITVKVEILDQQLIMNKRNPKNSSVSLSAFSQISQSKKMSNKSIIDLVSGNQNSVGEHDDIINKTIEQEFLKNYPITKKSIEQQNDKNHEYIKGQEKFLNIKISVIDTGVGISQEGLKKLFIDFGKLDENSTRNRKGTGLGLSICKQIIEQMGGSVDVKSELNKGTEFIINIKTKCKVQQVQFSEFADQEKFEKETSSPPFKRQRRQAAQLIFFKFIEKPKDELVLKTCMEEQIKKHRSQQNENQIEQLSEFERKFKTTKSTCKSDIQKLIGVIKSMQTVDKLAKSQDYQINSNKWRFSYRPDCINENDSIQSVQSRTVELLRESNPISSLLNGDQVQNLDKNDSLQALHNLSIQSQKKNVRRPSAFSFKDSVRDISSQSDQQQQNSSLKDNVQHLANYSLQSGNDPEKTGQNMRVDFQNVSLLEESKSESRNQFTEVDEVDEAEENSPSAEKEIIERQYKVLIANDDPMQLYMLQVIFQMNNFDVTIAQNGHEAYELVVESFREGNPDPQASKEHSLFDLILLDLNMPISDGYETCKNVVNLYNDSDKMFKNVTKKSSLVHVRSESLEKNIDDAENAQSQDNLHNQDLRPIILAVTSEIIDEELLQTLTGIGFDAAYEAPMKDAFIKNEILPKLDERRSMLCDKNQLLNIMKEGIEIVKEYSGSAVSFKSAMSPLEKSRSMFNFPGFSNSKVLKLSKKEFTVVRKKSSLKVLSRVNNQAIKKLSVIKNCQSEKQIKKEIMKTPQFLCENNPGDYSFNQEIKQNLKLPCFAAHQMEESKVQRIFSEDPQKAPVFDLQNLNDLGSANYNENNDCSFSSDDSLAEDYASPTKPKKHTQISEILKKSKGHYESLQQQQQLLQMDDDKKDSSQSQPEQCKLSPLRPNIDLLRELQSSTIPKINQNQGLLVQRVKSQRDQGFQNSVIQIQGSQGSNAPVFLTEKKEMERNQDLSPLEFEVPVSGNHYIYNDADNSSSSHSLRSDSQSPDLDPKVLQTELK